MCGIWSIVSTDEFDEKQQHAHDLASQVCKPRGPERTNTLHFSSSQLTFHRLAINGLTSDNDQPFVYHEHDGMFHVVLCNGEIYNMRALANMYHINLPEDASDTQIIYPTWKALKYDFTALQRELNGEYALAIFTFKVNPANPSAPTPVKAYVSTDPCSVRPVFTHIHVTDTSRKIVVSSLLGGISSLYQHGSRLPSGSTLTFDFDTGHVDLRAYVDHFPETRPVMNGVKSLHQSIVGTLKACVKRRMMSDRPIGCFLSGGLDSSVIAALVARECKERGLPCYTFSIGTSLSDDVKYAEMVAKHIGSVHVTVPFDPYEAVGYLDELIRCVETYDVTTIRASMGQYLLSKYIAEHTDIKVVFSGDGADEEQMGYRYFNDAPSFDDAQRESCELIHNIHLYDGLRVDRCVSVHGLEARVPYLDWEFVKLYLQIPAHVKVPNVKKGKMEKLLLRQAFEKLDPTLLPTCVMMRTKETFSDSLSSVGEAQKVDTPDGWYGVLQSAVRERMCQADVKSEVEMWCVEWEKHAAPMHEEGMYYRYVHHKLFGGDNATVIPRCWMPKWVHVNDPSARKMNINSKEPMVLSESPL